MTIIFCTYIRFFFYGNYREKLYFSTKSQSLRGGSDLKQRIWNSVKPIISEWTGKQLVDTSLYGIRIYKAGAILATRK